MDIMQYTYNTHCVLFIPRPIQFLYNVCVSHKQLEPLNQFNFVKIPNNNTINFYVGVVWVFSEQW